MELKNGEEYTEFLSLIVAPGESDIGQQLYHVSLGILEKDNKTWHTNCSYQTIIGKGDDAGIQLYGKHEIAEIKRKEIVIKFKKV